MGKGIQYIQKLCSLSNLEVAHTNSYIDPVARKSTLQPWKWYIWANMSNFDPKFQILRHNLRNDLYCRDQLVEYYKNIPITARILSWIWGHPNARFSTPWDKGYFSKSFFFLNDFLKFNAYIAAKNVQRGLATRRYKIRHTIYFRPFTILVQVSTS